MALLKISAPIRASIGTWTSPIGEAFCFLRQLAFADQSPFQGRDAEEILVPIYGNGPPPVGTTSFFYVDQTAEVLYFRVQVHPPRYIALLEPEVVPPN